MALESIWFFIWGLLWAVYFITDGFDLGIGTLYPFLGKSDEDKRIMLNSMGPLWDGNEVWLITAGGVTFAAFPILYAVMFSSLYTPLMLLLFALIIRGVSFEFRGKIDDPRWRKLWDTAMFIGSFLPALLLGVAFANIFKGLPIDANGHLQGNLFTLLNPYGLIGGVLFVLFFMVHGTLWLNIKTEGDLQARTRKVAGILWPILVAVAVIFLIASWFSTNLYTNYSETPILYLVPALAVLGLVGIKLFLLMDNHWGAWFSSALAIMAATFFGIVGLYPMMFPSTLDPSFSIHAFNAASSNLTLKIMLVVVIIFIPVVIFYQVWAYRLFSHKVTAEHLLEEESY